MSTNHKQVEGVAWDIIREAINTYDAFDSGEDYEYRELLEKIMARMMERYSLYALESP